MWLLVMPEWHDLAEKCFIGEFIVIKTLSLTRREENSSKQLWEGNLSWSSCEETPRGDLTQSTLFNSVSQNKNTVMLSGSSGLPMPLHKFALKSSYFYWPAGPPIYFYLKFLECGWFISILSGLNQGHPHFIASVL